MFRDTLQQTRNSTIAEEPRVKEVKYVIKLSAVSEFFYKMHRFE